MINDKHKTKLAERQATALASYIQDYQAGLNLGKRKRAARRALKNAKESTS